MKKRSVVSGYTGASVRSVRDIRFLGIFFLLLILIVVFLFVAYQPGFSPSEVFIFDVVELEFSGVEGRSWVDFPLEVEFSGPGGMVAVDGFQVGGDNWLVRFAPNSTGLWSWESISIDNGMDGLVGELLVVSDPEVIEELPNFRGHIRVADSGHFFEYADGTPFFWLGETILPLGSHRLGRDGNDGGNGRLESFLNARESYNFSVIQGELLSVVGEKFEENEGGAPFFEDVVGEINFSDINQAYFEGLDYRIKRIWNLGFVLSVSAGKLGAEGINISLVEALQLQQYLMARYGSYNVVWSLSSDYQELLSIWSSEEFDSFSSFSELKNKYDHPLSVIPSGGFGAPVEYDSQSSGVLRGQDWLSFAAVSVPSNLTGVLAAPSLLQSEYFQEPILPVVQVSSFVEGDEDATGELVRLQFWASILSGAAGFNFGHAGLVDVFDPIDLVYSGVSESGEGWEEGFGSLVVNDLAIAKEFFESIDWWLLEPSRELVGLPSGEMLSGFDAPYYASANGDLVVVYIPQGHEFVEFEVGGLSGGDGYVASWFNPRTAGYVSINSGGLVNTDGGSSWVTPQVPSSDDWVLLLKGANGCVDADADGFFVGDVSCGAVDCDETNPLVNPGLPEICGDGLDNDCHLGADAGCGIACPLTDSSLVLYFPFNGSGLDHSEYEVPVAVRNSVEFVPGVKGGAASFSGYENIAYIGVDYRPTLDFSNNMTFATWVHLRSVVR